LSEATVADITIDWDRGLVSHVSGKKTVLRPQSLAVLKELNERSGTLVSKDELIEKVWRGVVVTEDSLVQCITELRKALQDNNHAIIRTLPKRGYIFESGSRPAAPSPKHIVTSDVSVPSIDSAQYEKSIVVLPFGNLSTDADQDYFADGLTEDVITDLSNVPGLFVIARNSSFAYKGKTQNIKQIANDLGARYVLEGSIRKSAQRLRITVQMSDAETGLHVWAERFDRELADMFSLQDELTAKIVTNFVGKIHAPLPERRVHRNLYAYDLLLKGRALLRSERYAETVRFLAADYQAYDILRLYVAVALQRLGRTNEAAVQTRAFIELAPDWRAGDYVSKRGFRDQSEADWWTVAFRETGLPE
jgi:TolB-like protein